MIESLQRQITQLKDDVRVKEVEIDSIQKRRTEDDRDRDFMQRDERARAAKELDKCEKQIRELQTQKQIEYNASQSRIENLQHEVSQLQNESKQSQMQLAETKVTNANLQNQLENANREMAQAQVELSKLHAVPREGTRPLEDGEGLESREHEASAVLHEA